MYKELLEWVNKEYSSCKLSKDDYVRLATTYDLQLDHHKNSLKKVYRRMLEDVSTSMEYYYSMIKQGLSYEEVLKLSPAEMTMLYLSVAAVESRIQDEIEKSSNT